jgi:hypothetical protein
MCDESARRNSRRSKRRSRRHAGRPCSHAALTHRLLRSICTNPARTLSSSKGSDGRKSPWRHCQHHGVGLHRMPPRVRTCGETLSSRWPAAWQASVKWTRGQWGRYGGIATSERAQKRKIHNVFRKSGRLIFSSEFSCRFRAPVNPQLRLVVDMHSGIRVAGRLRLLPSFVSSTCTSAAQRLEPLPP